VKMSHQLFVFLLIFPLFSIQRAWGFSSFGDLTCGQLDQPSCTIFSDEFWKTGPCDIGLKHLGGRCILGSRSQLNLSKKNWELKTFNFQESYLIDQPINEVFVLRAVRSGMYKEAFPDSETSQLYGLTDLLNLGVRSFSIRLGIHDGILKLCSTSKCEKKSRGWFQWVEEISIWLRKNPSELVIIDLEESPQNETFKLTKPLEIHFGSTIFRPSKKKEKVWPSKQSLLKMGKKVIFFSQEKFEKDIFHNSKDFFIPSSNERGVGDWNGLQCLIKDQKIESLKSMKSEGAVTLEDKDTQGTLLSQKDIEEAVSCGVNFLSLINIDINKLGSTLWSWERGHPKEAVKEENVCVYLKENGKWTNGFCEEQKSFACEDKNNNGLWKVTSKKGPWEKGEQICRESFEGYTFSTPKRGISQKRLLKAYNRSFPLWLNQLVSKNDWPGQYAIVPSISGRPLIGWLKNVRQWSWLNQDFQMWTLVPRDENYFLLKNVKSSLCMSVADGLSENAANIVLKDCTGSDEQLWKLEDKGNEFYWVKNKNSQRCLDIEKTKKNNFDSIMQWNCYDVSQHKFRFLRVR